MNRMLDNDDHGPGLTIRMAVGQAYNRHICAVTYIVNDHYILKFGRMRAKERR